MVDLQSAQLLRNQLTGLEQSAAKKRRLFYESESNALGPLEEPVDGKPMPLSSMARDRIDSAEGELWQKLGTDWATSVLTIEAGR